MEGWREVTVVCTMMACDGDCTPGANTGDLVLRNNGDGFEFVFPTVSTPVVPCGWLVSVPVTANTSGLFVTLDLSVFTISCPSGLIVYNGSSAQEGSVIWKLCGDSAPLSTAPVIQVPYYRGESEDCSAEVTDMTCLYRGPWQW